MFSMRIVGTLVIAASVFLGSAARAQTPCVTDADCSDGNACNGIEVCVSGTCQPGTAVVCTALDQCHVAGACDPANGTCSNPNTADGSACTDGDACTLSDTCQAGICAGTNPVVCTALEQCHVPGVCDPTTGICSNPNEADGTACSDGNFCTSNDTCQAGVCGGAPLVCDDADPCTIDTCDPTAGCMVQPVTGLAAATCLLTSPALCQPIPRAIVKAIAQAQSRMTTAGATSNHGRAKRLLGQVSHTLKMAAKKALKFAKKRQLSPACAGALSRNLLEASSRLVQLRKTL